MLIHLQGHLVGVPAWIEGNAVFTAQLLQPRQVRPRFDLSAQRLGDSLVKRVHRPFPGDVDLLESAVRQWPADHGSAPSGLSRF